MTDIEERIKALEATVQELTNVALSTGGIERAWQLATLALLRAVGSSPEICKQLSLTLEETRRAIVNDGVAQAYADGYCLAARIVLETAYGADLSPSGSSGAH